MRPHSFAVCFSALAAIVGSVHAAPTHGTAAAVQERDDTTCPKVPSHSRADSFKLSTTLPGIPFAIPQSYAGYVPVNHTAGDDSRQLYFWYTPVDTSSGSDNDIIFWFNGGPGCSSMTGLMQENGPFQLPYYPEGSSVQPRINPWSNHRAAHAIWIDSPGDTGLSQAGTHIKGLAGVAEDMVGFLINFFQAFPDLAGKRLWLQGESYAGSYIPYMADRIYGDDTLLCKGINLKGVQVNDPLWASESYMQELAIYPYAVENQALLGLNDTQLAAIQARAAPFGLDTYYADHLVYPPKGPLPQPTNWTGPETYDIWGDVLTAWDGAHCSSPYDISAQCPFELDPLGFPLAGPGSNEPSYTNFLNNQTGFLAAIHARPGVEYVECKNGVFDGLGEPYPNESVMPGVIARSERTIIAGANYDMLLLTKGSELAIQNMTWNGAQGFQSGEKIDLVTSQGVRGHYIAERSLSLVQFYYAGHLVPEDDGEAAFKATQYLIGTIDSLA